MPTDSFQLYNIYTFLAIGKKPVGMTAGWGSDIMEMQRNRGACETRKGLSADRPPHLICASVLTTAMCAVIERVQPRELVSSPKKPSVRAAFCFYRAETTAAMSKGTIQSSR